MKLDEAKAILTTLSKTHSFPVVIDIEPEERREAMRTVLQALERAEKEETHDK